MASPADPQPSASELRRELETANARLLSLKREKKLRMAEYNERIRDEELEIEGILEQLEVLKGKGRDNEDGRNGKA